MRRLGARSLMAALAAGALACAPSASPRVTLAPDAGTPIEARLFPPHFGQVAVHVNKPAYIAVFEVVPGRGTSLLYPTSGSGFVQVEETWVPLRYSAQRWIYADNRTAQYAGYYGQADGYPGYNSYDHRLRTRGYGAGGFSPVDQPPRYLFVIASEEPLAVERFQGDLAAVRRELGTSQYVSYRAEDTMEQLALALLPYTADERWTSDVYVDWGFDWGASAGYGSTSMFTSMEPVLCSDGLVRYAPWASGWGFQSLPCTPMQWTQTPGTPGVPVPTPPVDSTVTPPPPAGEGRGRASGANAEERRRIATADSAGVSPDEARALLAELRERADRARSTEDLNAAVQREVVERQRADILRGGRGPVAGAAAPATRPNVGVSRTGRNTAADRQAAAERQAEARRERIERQRERDLNRAEERRRQDVQREQAQRRQEAEARREAQRQQEAERRERTRTPTSEPSSSGGRTRVPPASR